MSNRNAVLGIGGPLSAPPADLLARDAFGAELAQQRDLAGDVGLADLAHIVVALEAGVVPRAEGTALLAALLELQQCAGDLTLDPMLGDVYTNREAWLTSRTSAAGWLGVGRARREAITTGYTLLVRRRTLAFVRAVIEAAEAIVELASDRTAAFMPDYTYLQAAQPTTFAHYLLGSAYALLRDLARARSFYARLDCCPAGVGSTNGSALPLDRQRLATLLGFAAVVEHARDAMWQADGPIEALAVTCAASVSLDRLAEDLAIFSTAEFGFIELGDAHSRASKVMPQKKNPYALAYVRAVANRIIGVQASLAAAGRTPSGQMDNRLAAYGEVPRAFAEVGGAAFLMAGVVRGLAFDAEAARAALERSFAFASDLAELVMTSSGTDYRAAHAVVGRACRELQTSGSASARGAIDPLAVFAALDDAASAMLGRTIGLSREDVVRALDPRLGIERRCGLGGAATASVRAMIASCRGRLAEIAAWHADAALHCTRTEGQLLEIAAATAATR